MCCAFISALQRQINESGRVLGLTCRGSVAGRHVEAIVLMRSVGVRISGNVDAADRLLHSVVSKMEAALKAALVV